MDDKTKEYLKILIKYLNENHHPHTKIIVTPSGWELMEGIQSQTVHEFIKD